MMHNLLKLGNGFARIESLYAQKSEKGGREMEGRVLWDTLVNSS